ncbi:MAG: hypothetical protein SFY80_00100 [Verrucomicrobiota bacterium]|nr:hypothetical protein [Verrucomicrobiota bacterium]
MRLKPVVLCWFCSLLGVFVLSKQIPRSSKSTQPVALSLLQHPESQPSVPRSGPDHQQSKDSPVLRPSPDQLNLPSGMGPARREALTLYLRTIDPTVRKFWRSRIFDGLETADYPLMAQSIMDMANNHNEAMNELRPLMKTWTELDPLSAIQYLSHLTNNDAEQLIPYDFSTKWYEMNPEVALDWAWHAPASMQATGSDIVELAAEADPHSFFERLLNQPLSHEKKYEKWIGIAYALNSWTKDPELALSYLSAVSDGPVLLQYMNQMGSIYARQSVEDGYRWAQELSLPAQRYAALQGVLDGVIDTKKDPHAAMDTLLHWDDPYLTDRNFFRIGRDLINDLSYEEAREWIDSFEPNPHVQKLYYNMALKLIEKTGADLKSKTVLPETVMEQAEEWLSRIPDEKERNEAREDIKRRLDEASQVQVDISQLGEAYWHID